MQILHITPSSNGYEEVTLIANRIAENNHLALIEKNGEKFMTGGILLEDTPNTRKILDSFPKDEQYKVAQDFKVAPFVKMYASAEDMVFRKNERGYSEMKIK